MSSPLVQQRLTKTDDLSGPGTKRIQRKQKKPLKPGQKALKVSMKQRAQYEKLVFAWQQKLFEDKVDTKMLQEAALYLTPKDYGDVVIERKSEKICGYPVCDETIQESNGKGFKISRSSKQVYDRAELEMYCCLECYSASKYLESQLSIDPLYLRSIEKMLPVDIVPPKTSLIDHIESSRETESKAADENIEALSTAATEEPTRPLHAPTVEGTAQKQASASVTDYINILIDQIPSLSLQTNLLIQEHDPESGSPIPHAAEEPNRHDQLASEGAIEGFVPSALSTRKGITEKPSHGKANRRVSFAQPLESADSVKHDRKGNLKKSSTLVKVSPEERPKKEIEHGGGTDQVTEGDSDSESEISMSSSGEEEENLGWLKPSKKKIHFELSLFGKLWTLVDNLVTKETRSWDSSQMTIVETDEIMRIRKHVFSNMILNTVKRICRGHPLHWNTADLMSLIITLSLDQDYTVLSTPEEWIISTVLLIICHERSLETKVSNEWKHSALSQVNISVEELNVLLDMFVWK